MLGENTSASCYLLAVFTRQKDIKRRQREELGSGGGGRGEKGVEEVEERELRLYSEGIRNSGPSAER